MATQQLVIAGEGTTTDTLPPTGPAEPQSHTHDTSPFKGKGRTLQRVASPPEGGDPADRPPSRITTGLTEKSDKAVAPMRRWPDHFARKRRRTSCLSDLPETCTATGQIHGGSHGFYFVAADPSTLEADTKPTPSSEDARLAELAAENSSLKTERDELSAALLQERESSIRYANEVQRLRERLAAEYSAREQVEKLVGDLQATVSQAKSKADGKKSRNPFKRN